MKTPSVRVFAALAALILTSLPAAAAATGATFTKIADTSLVLARKYPIFTFAQPQLTRTRVVFLGAAPEGRSFLMSAPTGGGPVKVLAGTNTRVPGGQGTFTTSIFGYFTAFQPPNCSAPAAGSEDVVFVGRDGAGNQGIYAVAAAGGPVRRLVDYKTAIPGGPVEGFTTFNAQYGFCNVSVSGRRVAFDAGLRGVYEIGTDGKRLRRLADPNTPASEPPFPVTRFFEPSAEGANTVYVGGGVFGPFGLYSGVMSLGKPPLVAGTSDPRFLGFRYPQVRGRTALFPAELADGNAGIFRIDAKTGGTPRKIVDLRKALPKGAPGTKIASVAAVADSYASDGRTKPLSLVALVTTDGATSFRGLYGTCGTALSKLVAAGDVLDGVPIEPDSTVARVVTVAAAGKAFARTAFVARGGRYAAIYVATAPACR